MKRFLKAGNGVVLAASLLGFVSAFAQLFLVREFLLLFGDFEWIVGTILFCWIFITGLGSYLALVLEKYNKLYIFIFSGFCILAFAPALSQLLLNLMVPAFIRYIRIPSIFIAFSFLILIPVCLVNGILFSLLSQVFQKNSAISRNYAYESAGTLIAGLIICFGLNTSIPSFIIWTILGLLIIASAWIVSISHLRLSSLFTITAITLFILVTFSFAAYNTSIKKGDPVLQEIVNNVSMHGKLVNNRDIPVRNHEIVRVHSSANIQFTTFISKSFTGLNIKSPEFFNVFLLVPVGLLFIFISYFIFILKPTGRIIFISGFCCLAMEITIMMIYKSLLGTIYKTSGIVISIFMVGMVLGYGMKIPDKWNLKKSFLNIIWILMTLGLLSFLGLNFGLNVLADSLLFMGIIVIIGFAFSFFTGLLFTIGVMLEKGSMGKIVASTYGADMMGASMGALLVSSVLVPGIGLHQVSILIVLLLFIAGISLKWAK